MKYSEASIGRIFIIRLENGDKIPDTIEDFAKKHHINSAALIFLGGAKKGSKVIVGPEDGTIKKPIPMVTILEGVSESSGVGTIFLNEQNIPKLHMHSAFGRKEKTITGCVRKGIDIWIVGEVIILEIINTNARRKLDPSSEFELLEP